jgi:hypothetical protein
MADRLSAQGGTLKVQPVTGEGTTVVAQCPFVYLGIRSDAVGIRLRLHHPASGLDDGAIIEPNSKPKRLLAVRPQVGQE